MFLGLGVGIISIIIVCLIANFLDRFAGRYVCNINIGVIVFKGQLFDVFAHILRSLGQFDANGTNLACCIVGCNFLCTFP